MTSIPLLVLLSLVAIAVAAPRQQIQKCGQTPIPPDTTTNIIGGTDAIPYSWPWQILLYQDSDFECSGSVISDRWILTAGHCVTNFSDHNYGVLSPEILRIKNSVYKLHDNFEAAEETHNAKSIVRHPQFSIRQDLLHDIALIELDFPINFNKHVQPVCLPSHDEEVTVEPNTAWATGWGDIADEPADGSENLRQVNLPFVNFETCYRDYAIGNVDKVQNVCVGKDFKSACHGDSGGPLVVKNGNNAWFTYGITSWGNSNCKTHDQPVVYTRVSAFCDFINESTNGEVFCQDPNTYA